MASIFSSIESVDAFHRRLFGGSEAEFDAVFDEVYSPDVEVTISGKPHDAASLKAHFLQLRAGPKLDITVLYALCDGSTFAARQSAVAGLPDGTEMTVELYFFGTLGEDGRIVKLDEMVRTG
jgi:hypothetical protein